jgi:DNA polymerase III epsilon subunit family exonuclease
MQRAHASDKPFVSIDVETTGLWPKRGDRVIAVGCARLTGRRITAEFHSLIHTKRPIRQACRAIHGISNKMLAGMPPPEEVFPMLREFIGAAPVIAHNAVFDAGFLRYEFRRLGLLLPNRFICTLDMARKHFPELPNHRLETVARHVLGKLPEGVRPHGALDDARLAAYVWMEMEGMNP